MKTALHVVSSHSCWALVQSVSCFLSVAVERAQHGHELEFALPRDPTPIDTAPPVLMNTKIASVPVSSVV